MGRAGVGLASRGAETLALTARATIRRGPIGWASPCGINLRPYQHPIAFAIKESILSFLNQQVNK